MEVKYNIKALPLGSLQIEKKSYIDGKYVDGNDEAYCLNPLSDISNEPQEIQDACNSAWTPEVVQAYREHLESID